MSSIIPITLTPTAGFCVKSTVVQAVKYTPIAQLSNYPNVLEPRPEPIVIPTGFKIFINLAWESSVPPPPEADEAVIKRAMEGEDPAMPSTHSWYVPVVVSEGRLDRDKGKPFTSRSHPPCLHFAPLHPNGAVVLVIIHMCSYAKIAGISIIDIPASIDSRKAIPCI